MNEAKFIKCINDLEEAWKNIQGIEHELFVCFDDYSPYWRMIDLVVELLSLFFDDADADLISWFCWEKDFGRVENLGGVTIDGYEMPCDTASDLYKILMILKEKENE